MTVEIRELHIKGVVGADSQKARSPGARREAGGEEEREAWVAQCVERVLEILEREAER